jgi:hypothetical protein
MIRPSVNLDCFISVSLQLTDSTPFLEKFRGSGQRSEKAVKFARDAVRHLDERLPPSFDG